MRKNKFIFLALSSFVLSLCSCGNKQQKNNYDDVLFVTRYADNYTGGRIYGGIDSGSGTPSMYIDYKTMESTFLCARPNCTHNNNNECVARIVGTCPIMLKNDIYFFKYDSEVRELNDGQREFHIESDFCKVSLDSSEVENVMSFNDCAPTNDGGFLLYNNKIYFIGDDLNPQFDDYGGVTSSSIGGSHYICSVDLSNEKYNNYGSIYDGDKEYEAANYSSAAQIIGFYDSRILLYYEFMKGSDNTNSDNKWTELIFEFDPETNEIKESDIPAKPSFVDADTVIYYDIAIDKTVIIDKGERSELDIYTGWNSSIWNNKLFTNEKDGFELIWYDLSDMSVHNTEDYIGYKVIGYFNDCYIIASIDDTIKLTEEKLLALDKE